MARVRQVVRVKASNPNAKYKVKFDATQMMTTANRIKQIQNKYSKRITRR